MSNHPRKPRRSMVAVLVLSLLAPVSGLTASVVEAAPVVETIGEGSSVEQLSCPPGLTGPTCSDGVPQFIAKKLLFEATTAATVILGDKAVRSRGNAMGKSGSGPWTMSGTGSDGVAYSFVTDCNYGSSPNNPAGPSPFDDTCSNNEAENLNESEERVGTITTSRSITNFTDVAGTTVNNSIFLQSSGGINANTRAVYGSIYGPEVYTEKFTATAGQAISFAYSALGSGDEYEFYAFLVEVSTADYAAGTHTIIEHGRGKNQRWKTLAGTVPTDGTYRFRFVNGTYDGSGGLAVGSNLYIDPVIWLGNANTISFDPPTDKVRGAGAESFKITAKPTSNGPVSFTSDPVGRCTVSASTRLSDGTSEAVVTIPSTATDGNCAIFASSNEFGPFVPAPQIFRSFNVCSSAPTHGGGQALSGVPVEGERLEVTDGTINSCGDNYVRTYQWQVCNQLPCTSDSDFSDYGAPMSLRGFGPDKDQKGVISLTSALEGKRLRAKLTVTSPAGTFTVATAATNPVVGVPKRSGSDSGSDPTGAGPVSEPKPFVLPSGDTPRATPGEIVVYEGGEPVVVTSQPVTVGGIQSVRLGGTSAGGGKFEMTIGGDCPTCAVTQENDGKNVLGMEQAAAVRVGGYGFGPGSQVNVFVSSTTRLIGFFKADGDGAFLGSVKVPTDLPRGNHTIQVSGFTADNVIRSVSVGITVNRATPRACRVVKRKGKKPVTVCPKRTTKKVTKKK